MKQLKNTLVPNMKAMLVAGIVLGLVNSSVLAVNIHGTDKLNGRGAVKSKKPEMFDVIVGYKNMPGAAENSNIKGLGGQVKRSFDNLPMRSIRIPGKALEALRNSKGVEFVVDDGQVTGASSAAKKTSRLPEPGSANFVIPRSDVTVAVSEHLISRKLL